MESSYLSTQGTVSPDVLTTLRHDMLAGSITNTPFLNLE
jgi:hypothetical protein